MPLQKIPKTEYTFSNDPECLICIASENGKSIRADLDRFFVSHYRDVRVCMDHLRERGINISVKLFKAHMKKHSAFIETARKEVERVAEKTALDKFDKLEEYVDADELIQDIITIGGHKIQTGEMEVDSKLLVAALKEQGARKKGGTIRDLMDSLDLQRFGKIPVVEVLGEEENIT